MSHSRAVRCGRKAFGLYNTGEKTLLWCVVLLELVSYQDFWPKIESQRAAPANTLLELKYAAAQTFHFSSWLHAYLIYNAYI